MLHRSLRLAVTILAVVCSVSAVGQAAPPQFFVVCGSQPNEPTVYFSGVLQGPATAFAAFRTAFSDFLTQHYAYKGAVGCLPASNGAQAQKFLADRSSALRNAKKTVVDTGWTESAAAAAPAPVAPVVQNKAMAPVSAPAAAAARAGLAAPAAGSSTAAANGAASGGSAASNASSFASALGTIFGTGGSASAAGSGTNGTAGAADKSAAAKSTAGSGAAGAGGQSPFEQVSNTLSTVFSSKSSSGAAATDAESKGAPTGNSDGGLGSAQSGSTKLIVDGCGRQDTRVACVTELTNQNQKDTLVQATNVWTDAFIVDDRGDRHARSSAFFLNIDGDQRPQLDISYGKTARFILMFDDVPTKVEKVTLRSASSGLDVEDVSLIAPSTPGTQHH